MRPLTVLLSFIAVFGVIAGAYSWRQLPSASQLDDLLPEAQSYVYARSGERIGILAPPARGERLTHEITPLDRISPALRAAVVSSEDQRFYQHHGVDLRGTARALLRSLTGRPQGGSTITQQLVKNTLLADLRGARTLERKLKEVALAPRVERQYSKPEILQAYLNVVYWGSGGNRDLIGVADAARAYFGKSAADLDLAESVYLATLLPSPRRYFDYPSQRPLMRLVLERMVQSGLASELEADAAWRSPLQPAGWTARYDQHGQLLSATFTDPQAKNRQAAQARPYPHFMQAVQRELQRRLGGDAPNAWRGLHVYTTLDLAAQRASERASREATLPAGATLGLALVQPASGEVLALVGQKLGGQAPSAWDNATQARRQVGSSVKPLLYTLALQQGYSQLDEVLDAPIEGAYQPQNYDGHFLGRPVSLRYALDHSLNLPAVRLAQNLGVDAFKSKLAELGLAPPAQAGLSLAVGALEASPLQLASAYATLANGGTWYEPTFVRRVENAAGHELPLPPPASRRVWDEQTAYLGLDMIRGVVNDLGRWDGGLAWRARIPGWEVGGKTGTTNDVKDLWFAGVTPAVAGAVWVGKQEGGAMPQNAYSGDVAAPVWQQAVSGALSGRVPVAFERPSGITAFRVAGVPVTLRNSDARAASLAARGWLNEWMGGSSRNSWAAPSERDRDARPRWGDLLREWWYGPRGDHVDTPAYGERPRHGDLSTAT